jgi:methyl-accepting chemotaxis protein
MQMEQVTQGTAASAEESASASEELTAQSVAGKEIVHPLTLMAGTVRAPVSVSPHRRATITGKSV